MISVFLNPLNKHLAGKQFAADFNVRQVVTCLTRLTMQMRRKSKRMTKSKGIYCLYCGRRSNRKIKKNNIVHPLSSNTNNLIFKAEMRRVICEVETHYFYTQACQAKPSQAKPSQAKPSQAKPSQAKPSQSVKWGAETCAKRKSMSPCVLAIPAFDRIAGLSNRHLNSNRGIC